MANRFNQVIDQQYVPIPFDDMLKVGMGRARQRQQQSDLIAKDKDMLAGISAIPDTADEDYIKNTRSQLDSLTDKYVSDPQLLDDPNAGLRYRSEARKLIDPNRLGQIQTSYKNYESDIANRKELDKAGKLRPELIPLVGRHYGEGYDWDSSTGIYDKQTKAWSPTKDYTDKYFNNADGSQIFDRDSNTIIKAKTPEYMAGLADNYAEDYMHSDNFETNARILMGDNFYKLKPQEKYDLSKQMLRRDASEYVNYFERPGPKKGKGNGAQEGSEPEDLGHINLQVKPETSLTNDELPAILGDKDNNGLYQVPAGGSILDFPNELTGDAKEKLALAEYATKLKGVEKSLADLKQQQTFYDNATSQAENAVRSGSISKEAIVRPSGDPDERKAQIAKLQSTLDSRLQSYKARGIDMDNIRKLYDQGKYTEDAESLRGTIGDAIEASGMVLPFKPSVSEHNYQRVKNANDGTSDAYVMGEYQLTKDQADALFPSLPGAGSIKGWDWADKYIDDVNPKDRIIRETTLPDGKTAGYSIKAWAKVKPDDNAANYINRKAYSADTFAKNERAWQASRDTWRYYQANPEEYKKLQDTANVDEKGPIWQTHNNVGNIKVPDAGIEEARKRYNDPDAKIGSKAADGGNFIAFSTIDKGKQAIQTLLKTKYDQSKTVDDTLRRYSNSGYSGDIIPSLKNKKLSELTNEEFSTLINALTKRETGQNIQ